MLGEKLEVSLVTNFLRLGALLASEKMSHSCNQYLPSAAQLPRNSRTATKGKDRKASDPVMVYCDGAFL